MKTLLLKIMSPEGCDANSRQVAILLATLITLVLGVVLYSAMHILHPVEPKGLSNAPEVIIEKAYTPPGFKPLENKPFDPRSTGAKPVDEVEETKPETAP